LSNILITVVIPCFNEFDYIKICLDSLLNQTIKKDIYELIVVDGFSSDGTREILAVYKNKTSNILIIENGKRVTSSSCNSGIRNARGAFIAICGAHNKYNADYLENCLKLMGQHPEVDCVGGPVISQGTNTFSKSAAIALSSLFGIGNAKHRFNNSEGIGLVSQYPFFRKSIFNKIGLYNENLRLNEDDEFFYRIKRAGIKTLISPTVKSIYFVRSSPKRLFKQFYNYGYWRWKVFREHGVTFAARQLIPSIFIIAIIILAALGVIVQSVMVATTVPLLYFLILMLQSFITMIRKELKVAAYFPISVIILHFSYGLGFIRAFLDSFLRSEKTNI
jgi:glycosyltransferase involved in cell wall biosynthesis